VALTRVTRLKVSANMHLCAYDYVWKDIPLVYEQIGGISSASGTERTAVVSYGLAYLYSFFINYKCGDDTSVSFTVCTIVKNVFSAELYMMYQRPIDVLRFT